MRILIIGGAGEEGASVTKDMLKFYGDKVSKIILADKDLEKAEKVAACNDKHKVSTRRLDITNHQDMVVAMKDVDLVLNYVGPFYRWGVRVLKAAIEAKKHYIDIDDDSESTLKKLDLDEEARAAGITAIVGLGSGPGTDNLIAKHAADKLDRVDEINIYWAANNRSTGTRVQPRAVWSHDLHGVQTAGPQFVNGKFIHPTPLSGATWVDFDPPVGRAEVVYFGHPEAVTLPRYIKGLKTATNRGGMLPGFRMRQLKEMIDLGLTLDEPIDVDGKSVSPIDFMYAMEKTYPPQEYPGDSPMSAIKIEVRGEKDGHPQEYIYGGGTSYQPEATAGPASAGVLMIHDGDITKKGVFAPEGCIDNFGKFMTELKKRQF